MEVSSINFDENPCSGSRAGTCGPDGRTGGWMWRS